MSVLKKQLDTTGAPKMETGSLKEITGTVAAFATLWWLFLGLIVSSGFVEIA